MRCRACNTNLSDAESVRKDSHGFYLDLCNPCYHAVSETDVDLPSDDTLVPDLEDNEDHVEFESLKELLNNGFGNDRE